MIKFFKKCNINNVVLTQLNFDDNICNIHSYHSVYLNNVKKYLRYTLITYNHKSPISKPSYYCFIIGNKHVHVKLLTIEENVLEISYLSEKPLNLWIREKYQEFQLEDNKLWNIIEH